MIKDKWFFCQTLLLLAIGLLDIAVTWYALQLGFREGNSLYLWAFNIIGLTNTFLISLIVHILIIVLINMLRNHITQEGWIRVIYFALCVALGIRSFIVGSWFGLISKCTEAYV